MGPEPLVSEWSRSRSGPASIRRSTELESLSESQNLKFQFLDSSPTEMSGCWAQIRRSKRPARNVKIGNSGASTSLLSSSDARVKKWLPERQIPAAIFVLYANSSRHCSSSFLVALIPSNSSIFRPSYSTPM